MKKGLRNVFLSMSSTELRKVCDIYVQKDIGLQMEMDFYKERMIKYCFETPDVEKWKNSHNSYHKALVEKNDNKEEWNCLKKVAKYRKIKL